jgi:hypothetical protein
MFTKFASLALAAVMLSASPHARWALTVSPVKSVTAVGAVRAIGVYNTGQTPLQVTTSVREIRRINGVCKLTGTVPWASVKPSSFRLRPGGNVKVRVRVRRGASPGQHSLAALASVPAGQSGSVRITGAVESLMALTVPGHVSANAPKPCVAIAHTANGHGSPLRLGLFIALVLVALGLALEAIRRWRRNRNPRGRHHSGTPRMIP